MSRYPKAMYVHLTGELKIYTVSIDGYHQNMSATGFVNLNLDVPYQLSKKDQPDYGIDPYNFAYDTDRNVNYLTSVYEFTDGMEITDPIPLYDFYDMIGYERKTKKFNGQTMRKMIIDKMKAIQKEYKEKDKKELDNEVK